MLHDDETMSAITHLEYSRGGDYLFIAFADGRLQCVDARTSSLIYTTAVGATPGAPPGSSTVRRLEAINKSVSTGVVPSVVVCTDARVHVVHCENNNVPRVVDVGSKPHEGFYAACVQQQ